VLFLTNLTIGNTQKAAKGLTSLVNAQRTAELLARSLKEVNQVISAHEFRDEVQENPNRTNLSPHYEAAEALLWHHDESVAKLSALTADLGLLQIELPNRDLSTSEQKL
jgi:hypothetical protein